MAEQQTHPFAKINFEKTVLPHTAHKYDQEHNRSNPVFYCTNTVKSVQ